MALSDKDIALLYTQLELPIVVGDALADGNGLAPDEEYAFHEALSDMQPDAALLCMALAAEQVFLHMPGDIPESINMLMESERIVGHYGGLWLMRMRQDAPVPEEFIVEALKSLPSDFTKLKDTMAELEICLPDSAEVAAQLIGIMQVQIEAQRMVACSYLEALGVIGEDDEFPPRELFQQGPTANDNSAVNMLPC